MPYVDRSDKQLSEFYARLRLETAPCKLCGRLLWIEFEYERLGCCEECTRKVGNAYYLQHAGEHSPVLARDEWMAQRAQSKPQKRKKVISSKLRLQVFQRDGYRCLRCGTQKDLRADHVVPESKGGEATLENLQTLCHSCNSHKRTSSTRYEAAP